MATYTVNQLAALLGLPTDVCPQHKTVRWICEQLDHNHADVIAAIDRA